MPSSSTPTKIRKPTRLLTFSFAKISITIFDALAPLVFLRLAWTRLLQDPISTLAVPLVPSTFVLQTAFIILLLPLLSFPSKPGKKRGIIKQNTLGETIKSKSLIQSIFLLIPATLLFYIIFIVYGAAIVTRVQQTLLASLHLALLSTYPLSSSIHFTVENLRQLVTLEYETDVDVLKWTYYGAIGTLIGAWLGAIPIPLDWDRDWQKWPITIVVGAYIGHAVGLLFGIVWQGMSNKEPNSTTIPTDVDDKKKGQ